jgi:hypothetical protein
MSIYDIPLTTSAGEQTNLAAYKGKVLYIVNVASKCGLTPQYEGLEALYKKYNGDVAVLGFPANDFLAQEPGSDSDIQEFCTLKYNVCFCFVFFLSLFLTSFFFSLSLSFSPLTPQKSSHFLPNLIPNNVYSRLLFHYSKRLQLLAKINNHYMQN